MYYSKDTEITSKTSVENLKRVEEKIPQDLSPPCLIPWPISSLQCSLTHTVSLFSPPSLRLEQENLKFSTTAASLFHAPYACLDAIMWGKRNVFYLRFSYLFKLQCHIFQNQGSSAIDFLFYLSEAFQSTKFFPLEFRYVFVSSCQKVETASSLFSDASAR